MNENFIAELFKASLNNKAFFEVAKIHLNHKILPGEEYKAVWKEIVTYHNSNERMPSIGILGQNLEASYPNGRDKPLIAKCNHFLSEIKDSEVPEESRLLETLSDFVKNQNFKVLYQDVAELFSKGKQEEAIKKMKDESEKIHEFSLVKDDYDRVFEQFEDRIKNRKEEGEERVQKVITSGIHELDYYINGGYRTGRSALFLGRSGTGKSTLLRHSALAAARFGHRVVLFCHEGTQEENKQIIDANILGTSLQDIENGAIKDENLKKAVKSSRDIFLNGGEIILITFETFDRTNIEKCYYILKDIEKRYGKIDMTVFDYLELFDVKGYFNQDGGERQRRQKIGEKITSIATEFNCVSLSAIQAMDINPNLYNDPNFVMTRSHISEFKGAIKPFSYFITINQTDDEKQMEVVRLYNDKFRHHREGQTIKLFQFLNIGRFYNARKTLKEFWDAQNCKSRI